MQEVTPCICARDKNPAYNAMANDPHGPWTSATPAVDGDSDAMSNAQRSTLKWEKEEALGEMATVAPVLYTNINFPNLREEFPGKTLGCWVVSLPAFPRWFYHSIPNLHQPEHSTLKNPQDT